MFMRTLCDRLFDNIFLLCDITLTDPKKKLSNMTTKLSSLERRNFLNKLTLTLGGSAALLVAAPVVQSAPITKLSPLPEAKPESKGYQRTEHVDKYYQLADL